MMESPSELADEILISQPCSGCFSPAPMLTRQWMGCAALCRKFGSEPRN
jgi:hypothetical protein